MTNVRFLVEGWLREFGIYSVDTLFLGQILVEYGLPLVNNNLETYVSYKVSNEDLYREGCLSIFDLNDTNRP